MLYKNLCGWLCASGLLGDVCGCVMGEPRGDAVMLWMAQVATSHPSRSSGSWHRDSPCSCSSAVTQSIAIAAVFQPSAHCPGCSLGGVPRTPSLPILLILLQSLALKGWECLGVDPSLPRPWKELCMKGVGVLLPSHIRSVFSL